MAARGEPAGEIVRLSDRDGPVDPARLVARFAPPPRFTGATFASYRPNPAFPSQAAALAALERFASELNRPRRGLFRRLTLPESLYLDGGFGVGKTHLLAATWHAVNGERAFLSFQELVYTIGALGRERSLEAFARHRFVGIDEFELDDPGNALIVATFLGALIPAGVRVVTTSNTIPGQLGQGRFNAEDFRREIASIGAHFQSVALDGPDYRHRAGLKAPPLLSDAALEAAFQAEPGVKAIEDFAGLNALLARLHPIRYAKLLEGLDALYLRGLAPIAGQDAALRFVHLIDKLYDREVRLLASGGPLEGLLASGGPLEGLLASGGPLEGLFPAEYRAGAYAKKYARCLSRLGELLRESEPATA